MRTPRPVLHITQHLAVAFIASALVLQPAFAAAAWEILNPEDDKHYWDYSTIHPDGQGPNQTPYDEDFRVEITNGQITIGEHTGKCDFLEGTWDHGFDAPPSGWPVDEYQVLLFKKVNGNWSQADSVDIVVEEIQ